MRTAIVSLRLFTLLSVIASIAWNAPSAWGQYNSSSGGSAANGAFGSRTIGGGVNPSSSGAFNSGLGTSSANGSQQSTSGLSTNGQSSGMTGQSGQITGSERFLRQNRAGAFVGADTGDTSNVFSQQQAQSNQAFNSMFGQQGFFNQLNRLSQQNNSRNQKNSAQSKLRFAVRADLDGDLPLRSSAVPAREMEDRLSRLPALQHLTGVRVTMVDRVAILSGSVATAREKRLVEGVVLLEPGVGDVQNDLIVEQEATSAGNLPAASPDRQQRSASPAR